jgi:excinuclease ABC subunit C
MKLATRNAEEMLAREQARWLADQGKTLGALEELAEALSLPVLPARIECYDVSNFQGSETVASMVVFEDGKPRTGEYRRFRVRTVEGPNDVASHREVPWRRFRAARAGDEGSAEERRWAMRRSRPDRWRQAQVGAAGGVPMSSIDLPLAGLAKQREELVCPTSRPGPPADDLAGPVLVQRLRDGFTDRDHLPRPPPQGRSVQFDDLPGIGPAAAAPPASLR